MKLLSSKRSQLIVSMQLFVLLIATIILLTIPDKIYETSIQNSREKHYSVTHLFSYGIESAIFFNDQQALDDAAEIVAKANSFESLLILDNNKNEIYSKNKMIPLPPEYLTANNYIDFDNNISQYCVEIKVKERLIGYLIIQFNLNEIKQKLDEYYLIFFVYLFITLLVSFIGATLIGYFFTNPLRAMKQGFGEIAELNLNKRIEVKGNDEFASLATSFNKMVDRLDSAYSEISDININLENTIQERTLELQKLNMELEKRVEMRTQKLNATLVELQNTSNELQVALQKEKELGELKLSFISMISHEYRTPLSVILSSSSIISKLIKRKDFDSIDSFLAKIDDSVNNMVKLLEDVLSLGKSNDGKLPVEIKECNLEDIVHQLVNDLKTSDKFKQECDIKIEGNMQHCYTDELLIKQVISNLLSNAFKYSPKDSTIEVFINNLNDKCEIIVKDYGIGIPEDGLPKLFDTFYRAKNVGVVSGTGLGMPIIKMAVDALGGTIDIDSEVGIGTKVSVTIPQYSEIKQK